MFAARLALTESSRLIGCYPHNYGIGLQKKVLACLREDEISGLALTESGIIRYPNRHNDWSAWECEHYKQLIEPYS